jgi:pyrroline-5-carboxylate reductase
MTMIPGNVVVVGGGVMGEALLRGLVSRHLVAPEQVIVCEPSADRRDALQAALGVKGSASNEGPARSADLLLLAVKPQVLAAVLRGLAGHVRGDALVVSIVAGATIGTLREALAAPAVVRVMPNTPAQIGQGMSVWMATAETSSSQCDQAAAIAGALGRAIRVDKEEYIDMATALSGSGPAYVFLFLEALADAGVRLGFARPVAEELALQTVIGSALYARETGLHPAILRNQVTSPGGTTAEALQVLEEDGFRAMVSRAVGAAYRQAQTLGGKTPS